MTLFRASDHIFPTQQLKLFVIYFPWKWLQYFMFCMISNDIKWSQMISSIKDLSQLKQLKYESASLFKNDFLSLIQQFEINIITSSNYASSLQQEFNIYYHKGSLVRLLFPMWSNYKKHNFIEIENIISGILTYNRCENNRRAPYT